MKALTVFAVFIAILFGLQALSSKIDAPASGGDAVQAVSADTIPEAKGFVNDYAGVITPEVEARLEADLKAFPHQIAVLTVKTLGGLSPEEYGIKVGDKWKVGTAGQDDGVILIVATEDRKIRIEVGHGAEAVINDAKAGRIIREVIGPKLKAGDWDGGILDGVASIKSSFSN